LLGELTAALEPALGYASVLFLIGAALVVAGSMVRGYTRVRSVIERLETTAPPPPREQAALVEAVGRRHGLDVRLIMSEYPLSFVWGWRRSTLVLSSGLLRALEPAGLTAVLEHEAAHHARRDNLVKLGLAICGSLSLAAPLSRRLLRWHAEQVELVCDEVAAVSTSEPLEVADALVTVRRRTLNGACYLRRPASALVSPLMT
jgi:Zn-dependent protease with chaperone function